MPRFWGLLRCFVTILGLLLITLAALMTASRAGNDGVYWLMSSTQNNGGLMVQVPGERVWHPMRGFDARMKFDRWSPDNKWLYFHTTYPSYNATHLVSTLHRMRFGSLRRECLGTILYPYGAHPVTDFTLSPDYERVAYVSPDDDPNGLYITRGGCQNTAPIFRPEDEVIDSLFWSPDGAWLYFHTHHETLNQSRLYRIRPDGSGLELLSKMLAEAYQTEKTWSWSPDGTWMILRACGHPDTDSFTLCSLYTVQADGDAQAQIARNAPVSRDFVWTADGEWVIFSDESDTTNDLDLFRARPDRSVIEHLTTLSGPEHLYSSLPNGEWILFGSNEVETSTLYRMRADGGERQTLLDGAHLYDNLFISLDDSDSWIYISDYDEPASTLYRLRPDGSDVQPLVTGLFARNQWQVSPDGQYLLMGYLAGVSEADAGVPTLFRMRLDGSEQEFIPMESYAGPLRFSPIFNLPWHGVILFAIGALGVSFRAILTKVLQLFAVVTRLK